MRLPRWVVVHRDQCRGYDLRCVNCGRPLGGRHHVRCWQARHAYAVAMEDEAWRNSVQPHPATVNITVQGLPLAQEASQDHAQRTVAEAMAETVLDRFLNGSYR